MFQELTFSQGFLNSLVCLGCIRLQRQGKRLKEHLLQDFKPESLVLTRFLPEINLLRKDDSSNLVFNAELCVGSPLGTVVFVVKASSPDRRVGGHDSVFDLSADQVEASQILVCGEEDGHVLKDLGVIFRVS